MYTKIHKPKAQGENVYNNQASAGKIVNYLRSEELKENPNAHITYQTDKGNMNYGEAIQNIDNHTKDIEEGKVKFTSMSFNFSQEEAQALIEGKEGDNRTKEERLHDLTKKLMSEYGQSFPKKDIDEENLVYVAKVHEHRKKNGELNKEGQTHIHVVVANKTKDGQYINPETKHKKHFNKVMLMNNVQTMVSNELGTPPPKIKTVETKFSKNQTKDKAAIASSLKGTYYDVDGESITANKIITELASNVKGLAKDANKITIVEVSPKKGKGNYFNNPENALKSADQIMDNYAQSLKVEGTKKGNMVYYYQVDDKKDNPSLKIVISNRDMGMKKSVGANAKSFDFKKFGELNNKFYNQIVKEKEHISPTEKVIKKLNRKYKEGIDYKEAYGNKWLSQNTKEYKQAIKKLNERDEDSKKKIGKNKKDKPLRLEPVKQTAQNAVIGVKSTLMRMLGDKTQREDTEVIRKIKEREQQDQGFTRERKLEKN